MGAAVTVITAPLATTLADLARKLRVMAAAAGEGGTVSMLLSPAMSRDLAHLIDAGGFAGAVDGIVASKVGAAVDAVRAQEDGIRAAWLADCQGILDRAWALSRRARRDLVLTAVALVALIVVVLA